MTLGLHLLAPNWSSPVMAPSIKRIRLFGAKCAECRALLEAYRTCDSTTGPKTGNGEGHFWSRMLSGLGVVACAHAKRASVSSVVASIDAAAPTSRTIPVVFILEFGGMAQTWCAYLEVAWPAVLFMF